MIDTCVKIYKDIDVIHKNKENLKKFGKRAFICTGKSSSKKNGSLDDIIKALESNNQEYVIFNEIMENPTINVCYKASSILKETKCDFIIGVGGGSSLDASKVISYLAKNDVKEEDIFNVTVDDNFMDFILIPTTCGTGSEVTQYAILTDDVKETKSNFSGKNLFAKECYLDYKYLKTLPKSTLINTTLDSITHAIEGIFTKRCSDSFYNLALESLSLISDVFKHLDSNLNDDDFDKLLYASTLSGIVISKTGTSTVHLLGYSLTYYNNVSHGKANGLLIKSYLDDLYDIYPSKVKDILKALNIDSLDRLDDIINRYLDKIELTKNEIEKYVNKAILTPKYNNLLFKPSKEQLTNMFYKSVIVK